MKIQFQKPFWLNLYGAQTNSDDKEEANLMNENSDLGSIWKGRIMLSFDVFETQTPKLSDSENMENFDFKKIPLIKNISWRLFLEVNN